VDDAAIPAGLARQGHEFTNLGLGKDVLPLLINEIELLQPHECPHQVIEHITDTFLVVGDAHNLICLQDPGGAASFVQEVHRLPVITGFEGLGHRAFQGQKERCFKDAPARWILDGEDVLRRRSTLDAMFESGKPGSRISGGAHGDGYSMGLVA
jgi:hypothetical protein